jgi:Fic family protein
MEPSRFKNRAMGSLTSAVADGKNCWAFVPKKLPHAIHYDASMGSAIAEANGALGQLAGLARQAPNPHLLLGPFIRREAILSSRIEGTQTDMAELYTYEAQLSSGTAPVESTDSQEVFNYVRALEYGLARLDNLPISLRLIRELHATLLRDVRGKDRDPGNFRRIQNWIPLPEGSVDRHFVPAPAQDMELAMRELEDYLHAPDENCHLVRIAMIHYQFEVIHPFLDGNGRVGRLIIAILLLHWGLIPHPLLYLSAFFEANREEYYKRLWSATENGAITEWVKFFLRGVAEQALDASQRVASLQNLRDEWLIRVTQKRRSGLNVRLIDSLFESPMITIPRAVKLLEVSYQSAKRHVDGLVEMGILSPVEGQSYNKMFFARDILNALSA